MSDVEELNEEEKLKSFEDLRNPDVVTKYRMASDIASNALKAVLSSCNVGQDLYELCKIGDEYIMKECSKIFKSKDIQKGIGFPTCISVNNIVGSYSPSSSKDNKKLCAGDIIKIDLGCQVDGYVALVADTIVVNDNENNNNIIEGRKADVLAAVYTAAEVAVRMLKPGTKNFDITNAIDKVAKAYNVHTVEGVYSHQMKRFEIDGEKRVANNIPDIPLTGEQKVKECEMEAHEVWGLDIVMSTGTGKPHQMDTNNTTVFKRIAENSYKLKMKASRAVLSEIQNKFPTFPFSTRGLELDETKVRFGVKNCVEHALLEPYPVLYEKDGEFVAHVKFTVLLLPNGPLQVTGGQWKMDNIKSEYSLEDAELKELLTKPRSSAKRKKKKKKKKKN